MPIRLKKGQRPKYRMIHATDHAGGCVLMNDNMCKRWEALEDIQNNGQITLFTQDAENNTIDIDELNTLLSSKVKECKQFIGINVFLSQLFVDSGVKYISSDVIKQLKFFEKNNTIAVERYPSVTAMGKPACYWSSGNGKSVKIRCVQ